MKRRLTPHEKHQKERHEEWKESLRQACFNRARKNRRDLLWKKRRPTKNDDSNDIDSPDNPVMSVVEEELRRQRVAIVSPVDRKQSFSPENHYGIIQSVALRAPPSPSRKASSQTQMMEHQDIFDQGVHSEYAISEEELYELLQDVEEEMRRSEEELLEEVLEQEYFEQQSLEQQVADFEQWEDAVASSSNAFAEEDFVLCPLCSEGMLLLHQSSKDQPNTICCPNEVCTLKLSSHHITLRELKERLRLALEQHAVRCDGILTFELRPIHVGNRGSYHLVGSCSKCQCTTSIA